MITIKIAGLPIRINNTYSMIDEYSADYITDEEPIMTITPTHEDIERERKIAAEDAEYMSDPFLERLAVYRQIAEQLPNYDAFLLHGSVIECNGAAYIFTAHSGVGKTTHTRLWLSEFGDEVSILNGDKPIIRMFDGVPHACGTPWQGKENYGKNAIKELGGIVFLSRGKENTARRIRPEDAAMRLMTQIYLPKKSSDYLKKTLSLASAMLKNINIVELHCNMDPEAAHVCRAALIGDRS